MIIKFNPYFSDRIWGGTYIKNELGYNASDSCGEAWGISAVEGMESTVADGVFKGKSLLELFHNNKDLFGNYPGEKFPILVKVIDASSNLSIQVHPGDEYAKKHHNSFGKNESWYILETKENTEIIIGHNAKTIEELNALVSGKKYDELLNKFPIQNDQMFDIPAGTIHAICEGTILLEVQQSSDLTYRFYDYDRLQDGKPRELHVEQALNVIDIPSKPLTHNGSTDYFIFEILSKENTTEVAHKFGDFLYVIDGIGSIDREYVSKGDFIFIPAKTEYEIKGNLKLGKMNLK